MNHPLTGPRVSISTTDRSAVPPFAAIADRFVSARRAGRALTEFPGAIPSRLEESYAIQDAAIALWPDEIAGWKIGRVADDLAATLGADRLAGPVFRRSVLRAEAESEIEFPAFENGFSAVEAEFVLVIGEDVPRGRREWTREDARALVRDVRFGVELAGSPLASINDLGPTVVASDFGNNAGLILGPSFEGWRTTPVAEWRCRTTIDGREVGAGAAASLPGGPFEALRFLLALSAQRGRPLKAGDLISSGAVTGVHDILPGQRARLEFPGGGRIDCRRAAAAPGLRHTGAAAL